MSCRRNRAASDKNKEINAKIIVFWDYFNLMGGNTDSLALRANVVDL